MKLYYLYEIKINNPDSSLHNHYYFGKHEIDDTKVDNYYGSGAVIRRYIKKYKYYGLIKTILGYYNSSEELCAAEFELVNRKKAELGSLCINLASGGTGDWHYVNETLSAEQRHLNALSGGLGNKHRLEDPIATENWKNYMINRHLSMPKEIKENIYNKVSGSLKEYYQSEHGKAELSQRKINNKMTNKITAKKWRTEFYNLFKCTPESFRKYNKMQAALDLYKKILNKSKEEQEYEINRFMESINN